MNTLTPAMSRALVSLSNGGKVRTDMLERLAAQQLVTLVRERRMSGRNGFPSVWFVVVGAKLTAAGMAQVST
jgi:hypothetical protein